MRNLSTKKIAYAVACFLLLGTMTSCEDEDPLEDEKKLEVLAPTPETTKLGDLKASISPRRGSTLASSSVTFSWDHPGGYYFFDVGTSKGAMDIFESTTPFKEKSITVDNLPSSGKIYVRLYDYNRNGWWKVYDYKYTMGSDDSGDTGGTGDTNGEITPADGTVLTKNAVEFKWNQPADFYYIYVGTKRGRDDLYSNGVIYDKKHTVKNLPQSGTVYFTLWMNINNQWSSKEYTYTMNVNGDPGNGDGDGDNGGDTGGDGSKNFIITCVKDNLDPSDMYDFANGLKGMGYSKFKEDVDVSSRNLKTYLEKNVKTMYHTGHGFEEGIATSDGSLMTNRVNKVNVENLIIATCLTMKARSWKNKFGSTAKNIMGYTNFSYDMLDNDIAKDIIKKLKSGKSYMQAWYEVNNKASDLSDRWCVYSRTGNGIVEYSAVSGNRPSSSGSYYSLANGKVRVRSSISKKSGHDDFNNVRQYNVSLDNNVSESTQDFNTLMSCNISKADAIERAKRWVASQGTFAQAEFDEVVSLHADNYTIGYQVRFKRVINSLPVRGNKAHDFISLLITNNDIVTTQYGWSTVSSTSRKTTVTVLSPAEALTAAASRIASMYKGNEVKIEETVPCLGYTSKGTLVPAYEFISADGSKIIVDAGNGVVL